MDNKEFLEFLGTDAKTKNQHSKTIDKEKILVLADCHEPYGNADVYDEIEKKHKDASRIIIAGDLGDFYSKSRFRKQKYVSFKDELRAIFLRMKWLSERWKSVAIMIGNHDNRPEKMISQLMAGHEDLAATMTEQNIIKRLASYFPNIEIVGHRVRGSNIDMTHIYQLGDIVFTHAEISRMQSSATLERISLQLHRWKDRLGLQPFRVIAQAHNHDSVKAFKGSEWWYMIPTASNPVSIGFDYVYNSRMIGSPAAVGYSIFYQRDGVTDNNRSGFYLL